MARFEEIIDTYFTDTGDFFLGDNGDLRDTLNDSYRGMLQRVLTRVQSRKGDWATQTSVGAGLTAVIGKPNTAEAGAAIRNLIHTELLQEDLLRSSEFVVDAFPLTKHIVAVAIVITPPRSGGQVVLTFTYDVRDNRMIPRNI